MNLRRAYPRGGGALVNNEIDYMTELGKAAGALAQKLVDYRSANTPLDGVWFKSNRKKTSTQKAFNKSKKAHVSYGRGLYCTVFYTIDDSIATIQFVGKHVDPTDYNPVYELDNNELLAFRATSFS